MSAADLLTATRRTLAAVDRVLAGFWDRVVAALRSLSGPMSQERRRAAMAAVDREVAVVFGATRAAAITAQLFRVLGSELTATANVPPRRAVQQVKAIVERRDPTLWQTIRRKASRESADPFLRVVAAVDGPVVDAERMLRARSLDENRRWVKRERWNTNTGYRLSDRLWLAGKETRKAIDDRLREGIARGEDALSVADDLERFLRADFRSETITRDGKLIRKNQTLAPGRGGYGNFNSRRLARTETSRVFGAATIETAKITPGIAGIRWQTSARHPEPDECSDHADRDGYGLGRGVYPVNEVPPYPSHPMCLCVLVLVTISREQMIADVLRRYGGGA